MREMFNQELRNCVREIRAIEKNESPDGLYHLTEKGLMLIDTIRRIMELSSVSRKYGLLELEETAYKLEEKPGWKYLKQLINLVVDGTDPELVEEMAELRYYTASLSDYAALQYLIMVKGILEIQQGMNPRVIQEILLCMLPEEMADSFLAMEREEYEKEEETDIKNENELDMGIVEKMCEEGGEGIHQTDDCYYVIRLLEEILLSISDRDVQRLLQDVYNQDLCCAMKALNGNTRKIIFNNLSSKLAVMTAEDMEMLGPVRVVDVGEACKKIILKFLKLVQMYEIQCDEDMILKEMAEVFISRHEKVTNSEAKESENRLHKLWNEYLQHSNRWIGGANG